jgi:peptidoglycan/xylan/chitin deacetylase (PgdA/CDA1 family)
MKKTLALIIAISCVAFGQTKQICLSIDDLPVVSYGINDTSFQGGIVKALVRSLANNHVPAIGFVNERKLYDSTGLIRFRVSLLERWIECGMEIGNHTFSHPDFNTVSCGEYFDNIIKGETVTTILLRRAGKELRYFRHPFLHTGNTKMKSDSLNGFLAKRGYTVAPVTIDNDDYLFAVAYQRAKLKEDSTLALKIGCDYIAYMQDKLHHFEHQAEALFGRNISQILLIHASWLNADLLDSLTAMCRRNDYRFVDIDTALKDKAYLTPTKMYGNWGISWLDRWALSQGKPGSFFKDDPAVPAYITQLSR